MTTIEVLVVAFNVLCACLVALLGACALYAAIEAKWLLALGNLVYAALIIFVELLVKEWLLALMTTFPQPPPNRRKPTPRAPQQCGAFFHRTFRIHCV